MQAPPYGTGAVAPQAPRRQGWFNRTFPKGSDKRSAAIGAAAGVGATAFLMPHAAAATAVAAGKLGVGVVTAGLTAGKVLVGGLIAAAGPIGAVLILGGGTYLLVRRITKGRAAQRDLVAREEALMAREAELMEAENIIMQRAQQLGEAQEAMAGRGGGAGAAAAAEAEEAEALARERAAAGMGGAEEAAAAEEAARRASAQRVGAQRNPAAAAEAEEIAREAERLEAAMAEPAVEPVVRSERQRATRQPAAAGSTPVTPQANGAVRPAPMVSGGQIAALQRKASQEGKQLVVVQPRLISSRTDPRTHTVREDYVAADGITMKVSTFMQGKKLMKDLRVYKDGKLIPELSWRHETDDPRFTKMKDGSVMRTSRWQNGKTKMQDVGMRDANGNFLGSIRSRSPKDVE